ncbi:MAG: hypothetical protein ACLQGP_08030 [Isosphaeraceae bacterium]
MTLSASLPEQTVPVYCTDEDILVRAGGDFIMLCPPWQQMAVGSDGVFAIGNPWVLTSASVNFADNGVSPNQVAWLTAPKTQYPGGGQLLAIDSVSGNSITLRRPHRDLNVGQPPAPSAGLAGVSFTINTLDPQSEEASFDIKRRFGIDEYITDRTSSWIYDLRDLRTATVLSVLYDRYTQENRDKQGDFENKIRRIRQQLDDVLARVQVRWGPFGNSAEPSTLFGCKLSR